MQSDFLMAFMNEPYLFSQTDETLPELLLGASPSQLHNCGVDEAVKLTWAEIIDSVAIDQIRQSTSPFIDMGKGGVYIGHSG